MDNPSFGAANILGPEEGKIHVQTAAAATSTNVDLDTALPGTKERMSMVTVIHPQPFWCKFAPTNANAVDETATSGPTRAMGPFAANMPHRMRVPPLCRYFQLKSTAGGLIAIYESDGEY